MSIQHPSLSLVIKAVNEVLFRQDLEVALGFDSDMLSKQIKEQELRYENYLNRQMVQQVKKNSEGWDPSDEFETEIEVYGGVPQPWDPCSEFETDLESYN